MWKTRIVPAVKAVGLAVAGLTSVAVAMARTSETVSMGLGVTGVLLLAGSALIAVSVYLDP